MDEEQVENVMPVVDINIPMVTENLGMLTIDNNCSTSTESKRILRKRKPKLTTTEVSNRRCTRGPKKRKFTEMDNMDEGIKEYYLDKSIKKRSNNLETIYEESNNMTDDSTIHMSAKRFKRMLMFPEKPTNSKLKKRRAKIRRIFGSVKTPRRCISMQMLADKLNAIRESSVKIDNELE
ncbi:hypothetical protein DMN91_003456 [Ooceraea biroi]|uniref:Tantalus-like domain-containing protein n=1 Tax=Ooceraea biroi TaxID=2015173 RepID=A0A026X2C3_OOCBI|nr:uncharacterized protein LOC105275427 [Ooceraea biroi]EZA62442.1 hypothetical protein X777_10072 [Ooceraea biroi]RLU23253.1 hypothetical protein DMN91_003456 [Ooceraea biroi]